MNQSPLAVFRFNAHQVRTVIRDGAPWFVAADVAESLGYSSPKDASSHLDEDEKGSTSIRTLGGEQTVTIINESGLYALVLRSRKPEARRFAKWVTSEVLPAIRKTGGYGSPLTHSRYFVTVAEHGGLHFTPLADDTLVVSADEWKDLAQAAHANAEKFSAFAKRHHLIAAHHYRELKGATK
jgi:prophage antirepressor-like protein